MFPALRSLGMRFYAVSPLAGGVLTSHFAVETSHEARAGKIPQSAIDGETGHPRTRYYKPAHLDAVADLHYACKLFGITLQEASLRWLAYHSLLRTTRDDGIVLSASNATQLRDDIQAVRRAGPLPLPLVVAFDEAWDITKAECTPYFST